MRKKRKGEGYEDSYEEFSGRPFDGRSGKPDLSGRAFR